MLEGACRAEGVDADEVEHEDRRALQVDDEDLARECCDEEEEGAKEKYLEYDDGEERLEVPAEVVWADAGMIGPGSQGAKELSEE